MRQEGAVQKQQDGEGNNPCTSYLSSTVKGKPKVWGTAEVRAKVKESFNRTLSPQTISTS